MVKKIILLFFYFILLLVIVGCDKKQETSIKVGAIAGPEAELVATAQEVAQKNYGIKIQVITFSDYNIPNTALNDGGIDINVFQHLPFLQEQIKQHHYQITPIGKSFIFPMGLYSQQIKQLSQLKDGGKIAIPNDPSNEARALLLLQQAKLIELKNNAGFNATPADIVANPHRFQFVELDAAELPRALNDVKIAAITNTFAIASGLKIRDAIFAESADSPYANLIVVRTKDQNNSQFLNFVKAMNSPDVKKKAEQLFGDGAIPAWK